MTHPRHLLRYAFYKCKDGRRTLHACFNVVDLAEGWVRLKENFPDYDECDWDPVLVGPATEGPEAA